MSFLLKSYHTLHILTITECHSVEQRNMCGRISDVQKQGGRRLEQYMWEKDQRAQAADAAKGVAAGAGGSDAAEGNRSGQKCDPADRVRQAICDRY